MDLLSENSKPLKINEDPGKGIVVVAGLREMVRLQSLLLGGLFVRMRLR